jgi:hypothetical protein
MGDAEDIQAQFATRVLRPEIAQLELERLTNEVLKIYVTKVSEYLTPMPEKYQLTPPDWERYLDDIAVVISRTEGNRATPLTLKALTVTTGAGMVALGHALRPAIQQIGSKVSGTLAGKAAGKMAAKTGAKVGRRRMASCWGPLSVWASLPGRCGTTSRRRRSGVPYFDKPSPII